MSNSPRSLRRLGVAIIATVLTAALAACSGGTAPAGETAAAGEPVEGGILRVGLASDTPVIDPHLTGNSVAALIGRNVVDSLVGQAPDNSYTPWLATEWTVNDTNTEYVFTLREDVTFSDGEELDAAAVKSNFDRILDPETNSSYAASLLGPVESVEAPDDTTVVLTYSEPFASLLQGLSLPYLGIQSPAFINSGEDTSSGVVGSGPFVLDSYAPGQGSVLSKREDYNWGPGYAEHTGPAYLDGIEFSILPEASTRLGALQSGQVHAIDEVPPANYEALDADPSFAIDTYENPGVNYAFQLNTTKAPFDDVRVRQAFQSGANIEEAVNATFFGTLNAADNIVGANTEFYDETVAGTWGYDADRANTLLDEAGWSERDSEGYRIKDGERLTVDWVYDESQTGELNVNLVQALQSQYRDIGLELKLISVDSGGYTSRSESGDYDTISFFFVRPEADILRTVYSSANIPPNGSGNVSRVESLDEQLEEAVGAAPERREELYSEVQHEIIDEAYSVPLYVVAYQLGRTQDLQGITWATNAKPLFYDAWLVDA
ncbi:ABC transporter substrate-binding protein [Gulosibacter sp. 10]|uniref:ABC transporter substrate-binding protein n=1 Tax=Gulosibacter sp. 10 TaxID=1255570 RepID=UPI00097EB6C1|nr:ABC transporter substrate-binding protein [Gulosibacter sp. 10]SJM64233.1 Oligopeptide ABC transporter, periplasmic oligopeptide-binding protein OppA (TC 3.A.1.5.1) [Gulosibacter sp. 10]